MTRNRTDSTKRRVERFFARRVLYEEDGLLKIFELPKEVPFAEAIRRFEAKKGLRADPELGVWRRAARQLDESPDAAHPAAHPAPPDAPPDPRAKTKRPRKKGDANHDA